MMLPYAANCLNAAAKLQSSRVDRLHGWELRQSWCRVSWALCEPV